MVSRDCRAVLEWIVMSLERKRRLHNRNKCNHENIYPLCEGTVESQFKDRTVLILRMC